LVNIGYDRDEIVSKLKNDLLESNFINKQEKDDTLAKLKLYLSQNGYLRTTN
jgi:arginine decarboxylase